MTGLLIEKLLFIGGSLLAVLTSTSVDMPTGSADFVVDFGFTIEPAGF